MPPKAVILRVSRGAASPRRSPRREEEESLGPRGERRRFEPARSGDRAASSWGKNGWLGGRGIRGGRRRRRARRPRCQLRGAAIVRRARVRWGRRAVSGPWPGTAAAPPLLLCKGKFLCWDVNTGQTNRKRDLGSCL